MAREFWLSDRQWAAIEPLLPKNRPGARRVDDRRVISGIVHVLKVGCRWQDCPPVYGPPTTIYNRFHRWAGRGLWQRLFAALVDVSPGDMQMIDSTTRRRTARQPAEKGGANPGDRPLARRQDHKDPRHRRSSRATARL